MANEKVNKVRPFGGHRFVIGPPGEIGYIAKKPGHGAALELILLKREQNRENERKIALKKADTQKTTHVNGAVQKWVLMDIKTTMDRMVNLGLQRADEELRKKRNRLKIALLEEEAALMYEYTNEAQKVNDKVLSRNKQKVEGILNRKILSDKTFNEAIKEKIALTKSETYAEHLSAQNLKNAIEANRAQIRANEYQKAIEQEEEQLWEKLDRERVEEISDEMRAVSDLRRERQKIYRKSLDKQVESNEIFLAKKNMADNFEDEILKKLEDENFKKLRARHEEAEQRRRQHYEDSRKQKDDIRNFRLKNENEDLKFEEMLGEDVRRKFLLDESKQVSQKEQLKRELTSFQTSIQRYKQMDEKADEDFEKVVAEEAKKSRVGEYSKIRRDKMASKKRMAEIVSVNKRLAADKLKRESAAKEFDNIYHEFQTRENEILNKVDEMLQSEYRKNYETAPTNLANADYVRNSKLRQKSEENEDDRKIATETDEMEATVREKLAKRSDDYSAKHPFYGILMKGKK